MKKLLSFFLTLVLVLSVVLLGEVTVSAATQITENTFYSRYNSFKANVYPDGKIYTNNSSNAGGTECFGYANEIAKYIYGSYPTTSGSAISNINGNWQIIRGGSAIDQLHIGDIVRYRANSWDHSIFVYNISGNTIYYTDANGGSTYNIVASGSTTKSELKTKISKSLLGNSDVVGYVARYRGWQEMPPVSHTINTSYAKNFIAKPKEKITATNIFDANHNQISSTAWIGTSDKCTIHEVYTDGCCKVSYPLNDGGTETVYSKISLFNINHTHSYTSKVTKAATCTSNGVKTYTCSCGNSYTQSISALGHDYTGTRLQESAHPHQISQRCVRYSTCGGFYWTGENGSSKSCSQCWNGSFTTSTSSVNIKMGESTDVKITLSGVFPDSATLGITYDTSIISVTNSGQTFTFKGLKSGTCTYKITVYSDSSKNVYICSKSISVTVSPITYTISYNANGGTGAPASQTKTHDIPLTLSSTIPKRTGYTFMGWAKSNTATGTSVYPGTILTSNSSYTFYAVWENAVQLYYNGSFSSPIYYGNQEYYFKYTPSQSGKHVIYSEANKDTKVYLYNSSGTLITSNDDGGDENNFRLAYNLTAGSTYYYGIKFYNLSQTGSIPFKFGKMYTVKYNSNGGTGAPFEQEKDYGKSVTISTGKPTRSGYEFLGWSTSSTATTPNYQGGEIYSTNSNLTLYAVWEKIVLDKVEIKFPPTKTIYNTGESLDTSGLTLTLTYSDGTVKNITSGFSVSGFDSSKSGKQTVYVSYDGKKVKYSVTVKEPHVHNYKWKNDKNATCTQNGIKHEYCIGCENTKNINTLIPALGHTYSNACDKSCNACGTTRTVSHKYNSGKITTKATCKAAGVKTYICTTCKATKNETIAKLKTHTYKTTTTKATLSKNGNVVKKCTVCGKIASTTTIKYVKAFKLSTTSYTYNGKIKTPTITVKDSAGKTLKKNTDYTVTYASGRKNVGTYKVIIKMKGNYSGSKTLAFKINPVKTTVSKLTTGKKSISVAIAKKSVQVTGYQVQCSTSKKFTSAKTKTISSCKTTKYTLKNLSTKKTYYVRVRTYKTVGKTKYYSGWSTYKYVKTK